MLRRLLLSIFLTISAVGFSQGYKYHKLVDLGTNELSSRSYCNVINRPSGSIKKWNIYLLSPLIEKQVYKIYFEGTYRYYYVDLSSNSSDGDADEYVSGIGIENICTQSMSYKLHRLIDIGSNIDDAKSYCHYESDSSEGEKYGVWSSAPLEERRIYKAVNGSSVKYYFVVNSSLSGAQDANEFIPKTSILSLENFCGEFISFPSFSDENFVLTISPLVATRSTNNYNTPSLKTISYYDGLGRLKQEIGVKQSPNKKDIVTHIEYDDFSRQSKEYLPYSSTYNDGMFKVNALNETNNFYITHFPEDINTSQPNPFSEKEFDDSPLSRIVKQAAPGYDWRLGGGKEMKLNHQTNSSTDIRKYYVTTVLTDGVFMPSLNLNTSPSNNNGYYLKGQLYKTVIKDENHSGNNKINTVEEYKNKQGQLLLHRKYITSSETLDTYYVYDDLGNLTYVLPPKSNPNHIRPNSEVLSQLCNQYKYDTRNRLVEKKIGGKGWEYIIYDKLDRVVLTQDANQRSSSKWSFIKYDLNGRVVYKGIYEDNTQFSRVQMQAYFDNQNIAASSLYETKLTSTGIQGSYYSNNNFPNSNIELLIVSYYDDYVFDRKGAENFVSDVYGVNSTNRLKNIPTGAKVKVLGTNSWITRVAYYDEKGRQIYLYVNNEYLSSIDVVKTKIDFTGNIIETTRIHNKTDDALPILTIVDKFSYDHANRLIKQTQTIGGLTEVIELNSYDEIGMLKRKGVGGKDYQERLQVVDYKYNIRRWLREVNNTTNLGSDLFAFKISYNKTSHGASRLFNGNISEIDWRTKSDNQLRWYKFSYDPLNRIKSAIDNKNYYSLSNVDYDSNGNILRLERRGQINNEATNFGLMDNISYTYHDDSNKLIKVEELSGGNPSFGFKDAFHGNLEYTYDLNGNMLRDYNKGIITDIKYNHLNLPTRVSVGNKHINYVYDATGLKVAKIIEGGSEVQETNYTGNFVYKKYGFLRNPELEFFNHPGGYVVRDRTSRSLKFNYVYQYKDHLGNVRLSYGDKNNDGLIDFSSNSITNEIIEESNYYPFGLKHKGYNNNIQPHGNTIAQGYSYNGKELIEEIDLGWYNLGSRIMDPTIGRFLSIDPLADFIPYQSVFALADNNPIHHVDYQGLGIINVLANLWKRLKLGLKKAFSGNECSNEQVTESVGEAWRRADFPGINKFINNIFKSNNKSSTISHSRGKVKSISRVGFVGIKNMESELGDSNIILPVNRSIIGVDPIGGVIPEPPSEVGGILVLPGRVTKTPSNLSFGTIDLGAVSGSINSSTPRLGNDPATQRSLQQIANVLLTNENLNMRIDFTDPKTVRNGVGRTLTDRDMNNISQWNLAKFQVLAGFLQRQFNINPNRLIFSENGQGGNLLFFPTRR